MAQEGGPAGARVAEPRGRLPVARSTEVPVGRARGPRAGMGVAGGGGTALEGSSLRLLHLLREVGGKKKGWEWGWRGRWQELKRSKKHFKSGRPNARGRKCRAAAGQLKPTGVSGPELPLLHLQKDGPWTSHTAGCISRIIWYPGSLPTAAPFGENVLLGPPE